MFLAMNRFRVTPDASAEFERVWAERESQLSTVPGFVSFHLLRGPAWDDHRLYASHTIWRDRAAFEGWTRSEAFRAAHRNAGGTRGMYLGPPEFEGFEPVLSEGKDLLAG